jgi:hypothetical protein
MSYCGVVLENDMVIHRTSPVGDFDAAIELAFEWAEAHGTIGIDYEYAAESVA